MFITRWSKQWWGLAGGPEILPMGVLYNIKTFITLQNIHTIIKAVLYFNLCILPPQMSTTIIHLQAVQKHISLYPQFRNHTPLLSRWVTLGCNQLTRGLELIPWSITLTDEVTKTISLILPVIVVSFVSTHVVSFVLRLCVCVSSTL